MNGLLINIFLCQDRAGASIPQRCVGLVSVESSETGGDRTWMRWTKEALLCHVWRHLWAAPVPATIEHYFNAQSLLILFVHQEQYGIGFCKGVILEKRKKSISHVPPHNWNEEHPSLCVALTFPVFSFPSRSLHKSVLAGAKEVWQNVTGSLPDLERHSQHWAITVPLLVLPFADNDTACIPYEDGKISQQGWWYLVGDGWNQTSLSSERGPHGAAT